MLNLIREDQILNAKSGKKIFSESNKAYITGIIEDNLEFHNEFYGEKFYKTRVAVKRESGVFDYIPIIISERETDLNKLSIGVIVEIAGQFRSYNYKKQLKTKLELYLFVKSINVLDNQDFTYKNQIFLDGYICKEPFLRETSLRCISIADLFIAVNREHNRSDYIPAIVWGRNASYASQFEIGSRIQLLGRIQSRIYKKKGLEEENEVYEVSINSLKKFNK